MMRNNMFSFALLLIVSFCSQAHAADTGSKTLALGLHGISTYEGSAHPMLRWRPTDTWAFDLTPDLGRSAGRSNSSTSGSSANRGHYYGANVGIVKQLSKVGGVSIGWRGEIGYEYDTYSNQGPSFSWTERAQYLDLGTGPDLEYFVPSIPGLSIGASALINCSFSRRKYADLTSESVSRSSYIDLTGEFLTVRYYF